MGGATSCFAAEDTPEYEIEDRANAMDEQSLTPRARGAEPEGQPCPHESALPEELPRMRLTEGCQWAGDPDAPRIGSQVPQLDPGAPPPSQQEPSWSAVSGGVFRVRHGPDYSSNGFKAASLPALYDCVGVDMYRSKKPVHNIGSQLQLPVVARPNPSECVPSTLILNVMVPTSSPSMFSPKTNGETINVVFCFVIRESTAAALQELHSAPGAVQLLDKYFRLAPHGDPDVADRIKLMGKVNNWEQAELPSMLSGFNGKPTLVTKSGMWYQGEGYAELDCNTAHWCYMARKGLHSAWKNIGQAVFDFGVVVEAREDKEMPEQLLGCAHLNHLHLAKGVQPWRGSSGPPSAAARHWKCAPEPSKPKSKPK